MANRQIVYIGQIPLDTDMLSTNLDSYIGLSKLAAGLLGINQLLNAFTCIPTAPASMQINVTPGEIYSLQNVDNSTYGSIPSDTVHQIVKQGVNLDNTTLTLTAPTTPGDSWNYLIEIGFSETDGGSTVLPYYNASDPSQAWSGPNNDGTPNNTIRQDTAAVQFKRGTAAPTGTQTTPSPDSGFLGAFVVTVAYGQTTVVSGNISTYSSSNFINETLTEKISQATADLRYSQITQVQNASLIYGVDSSVSANTITAALSPALTSYVAGQTVYIKAANTNTGATTINLNGLGSKNVTFGNGGAIGAGDIVSGGIAILQYDGTQFQLKNPGTADFSATAIQNNSYIYATDTGSANAYVCALTPAIASYSAGLGILLKIANNNTTASTINVNGLGTKNITYVSGSAIVSGDLLSGGIAHLVYDGTQFQLLDPATVVTSASTYATKTGVLNQSYVYAADSGSANAYVVTLSPVPGSYTTGMAISVKITNTNTTASTINVNGLGTKNIKYLNAGAIAAGDLVAGGISHLIYDGTQFQLLDPATIVTSTGSYATQAGVQDQSYIYAADGGSANAYAVTLSPAAASYVTGMKISTKIANANTGASTINVNSLGTKSIKRMNGSALLANDLLAGQVVFLVYDGTNFQLENPAIKGLFNVVPFPSSGTYTPSAQCTSAILKVIGGGGGGGGSGSSNSGGAGGNGGTTSIGSIIFSSGGAGSSSGGGAGGPGGAGSGGNIANLYGGQGSSGVGASSVYLPGGPGGNSVLGGGGGFGTNNGGYDGAANTGSGGGGCGATISGTSGAGGGAGGYSEHLWLSPATETITIGASGTAGAAGTGGNAGGVGGTGFAVIYEYC